MNRKNNGFTLMEIIVALALIGIIAAGLIPAFAAQYKMTVNMREFTAKAFDAQADMENSIFDLKNAMTDPRIGTDGFEGAAKIQKTIFGKTVTLHSLRKEFPFNENKEFIIFLSPKLADMELRQLLVATGVKIKVEGGDNDYFADLKRTPKPWLQGLYDANLDNNFYDNKYEWYVSNPGNPNPVFPGDYRKLVFPGITSDKLTDLHKYANRYVVFTVTPVDIHGVRGNEVRSTNEVYIIGEEWRTGVFAWVDKDDSGTWAEGTDVPVNKKVDLASWPLISERFGDKKFLDPITASEYFDPRDGSLYVPMGIDRGTATNGTISVTGTSLIDWIMDKSIHLAADIEVGNNSDIKMTTKEGDIILYQYVKLDADGKAVYDANGKPEMIDKAVSMQTKGEIILAMEGQGDVTLQNHTKLSAEKDISIMPYGRLNIFESLLETDKSILLDSSKGNAFPSNRDISISDSVLNLKTSSQTGRNVTIRSKHKAIITGTTIKGNPSSAIELILEAPTGISLTDVKIENMNTLFKSNATMNGGSWDSEKTVTVENGKALTFANSSGKVKNNGSLFLGDTGGARFANGNSENLTNPLKLFLKKGAPDEIKISSNYGRNVGYAKSKGPESVIFGSYYELGSDKTNLRYMVNKTLGAGNPSLSFAFDGTDTITISASGVSETGYTNHYELSVQDRYAIGVTETIGFTVSAIANSSPVVSVKDAGSVSTFTVTFDSNGGSAVNPPGKTVKVGEMIGSLPEPPVKAGAYFGGWTTEKDGDEFVNERYIVTGDMTVYAKWRLVPSYRVTFYKNDDSIPPTVYETRDVLWGEPIGKLPKGPKWTDNHQFAEWNTNPHGGGITVKETMIITGKTDIYALYDFVGTEEKWQVNFNKNGGDTDADPKMMFAFKEEPLGSLPEEPTRAGYYFVGWYFNTGGTGTAFTEKTIVDKNMTVYAKWSKKAIYKATFYNNFRNNDNSVFATVNVISGDPIGDNLPDGPFRSGYRFNGWFTARTNGTEFTRNDTITRNTSFYAQWSNKPSYTVTFNNNGGTGSNQTRSAFEGEGVGTLPANPTRSGYVFDGWNTKSDGSGTDFDGNTPVNSNMTVYAQWETARTVTVTFDPNGGNTPNPATKQVTMGERYGPLATVTHPGEWGIAYRFTNWYSSKTGGTIVNSSTYVTDNNDHSIYARWTEVFNLTKPSNSNNRVLVSTGQWSSSSVTINKNDSGWKNHGDYQIRVVGSWPQNLKNLKFTRLSGSSGSNRRTLAITGEKNKNNTFNETDLTVEVRSSSDNSVITSFKVRVSGSENTTSATIRVIDIP